MNLQARRIDGNEFTQYDKLEVRLNDITEDLQEVVHRVVLVSGETITHGGGASADDYLHYGQPNPDDEDALIDYSTINMWVEQQSKGTSVFKVEAQITTVADNEQFIEEFNTWKDAFDEDPDTAGDPPTLTTSTIQTGEITVTWGDDTFV